MATPPTTPAASLSPTASRPGSMSPGTIAALSAATALVLGLFFGAVAVFAGMSLFAGGGPPGAEGGPGGMGGGPGGPPPAKVRVAMTSEQSLQERFEVVGRLTEVRRAVVAAETEGKVIEMPADEGTRLEAGKSIVARIEPVWAETALAAAESRVASARATLEQSHRELQYLEELQAAGSARPKEVDDIKAQVKANAASLDAAVAMRDEAGHRARRVDVLAPFDAVVVKKHAELGQWLDVGSDVAEIVSVGEIDAVVDVPETIINAVQIGQPVEVRVEPLRETVTGQVIAIVPAGGNAARTFPVKVRLDDREGELKPGMSVTALIPLREMTPQVTVPRDAVVFGPQGPTVWLAAPGQPMPGAPEGTPAMSQAVPLGVQVLFGEGERFAVRALPNAMGVSLGAGMPVVIEGAERLFPTQPLEMIDGAGLAQPTPTPAAPEAPAPDGSTASGEGAAKQG